MIYRTLRWVAGIMLHWFYADIEMIGAANIPATGGLLIAVNHPNALVDTLVAAWVTPRNLRLTAKATLDLRLEPVLPDPDVHNEGNGKLSRRFHLPSHQLTYAFELRRRNLENELVVHLEQHFTGTS